MTWVTAAPHSPNCPTIPDSCWLAQSLSSVCITTAMRKPRAFGGSTVFGQQSRHVRAARRVHHAGQGRRSSWRTSSGRWGEGGWWRGGVKASAERRQNRDAARAALHHPILQENRCEQQFSSDPRRPHKPGRRPHLAADDAQIAGDQRVAGTIDGLAHRSQNDVVGLHDGTGQDNQFGVEGVGQCGHNLTDQTARGGRGSRHRLRRPSARLVRRRWR